MTEVVVLLCTAPEDEAGTLVDRLLDERLVACVNMVGPVLSRYRWQGRIEEGREMLLVMKTTRTCAPRLRARIAELHGYEVPEVLEVGVDGGLDAYLAWVVAQCQA